MIPDHLNSIFRGIDCYFNNGISVSTDILSFAETTLGIASIEELGRLLAARDPDVEGLLDLIFSPDRLLSISIEPFIPHEGAKPDDMRALSGMIMNAYNAVMVMIGDTGVSVPVMVTEPLIARFIAKLNMEKPTPFLNTGDIRSCFPEEEIISFRVLHRHSRHRPSAYRDRIIISLLCGLFRISGGSKPAIVHDCLSHLLELFSENPDIDELRSLLSMKMRQYKDMLEGAAQFSDYIKTYTMEFLMSQKIHPPTINTDEIRKKMYLTELISSAVFDEPVEDGPREYTLRYNL